MNIDDVLKDIENYEDAYYERLKDLDLIKNLSRKSLSIHLGGVVVECRLKQLIVKKYRITKQLLPYWFDAQQVNDLKNIETTFTTKDDIIARLDQNGSRKNPQHRLNYALHLLPEIRIGRPENAFESIYDPLTLNKHSYIDVRYHCDMDFTDEFYAQWYQNFIEARKWIEKRVNENKAVFR